MRPKLIRFRPRGCKGYPFYDIVVIYKDKRHRGDFIERLGFFNPNQKEHFLFLDVERLGFWLNKGAFLNSSVKKYLSKFV